MNLNGYTDTRRQAKGQFIRLLESATGQAWDWLDPYLDLFSVLQGNNQWPYPLSTPNDRRYGMLYPLVRHETQLALLRAPSRICYYTNPYAQGLYAGLESFVIGDGGKFTIEPIDEDSEVSDIVTKAQRVIDDIMDEGNDLIQWPQMRCEGFNRRVIDGEFFRQHWMDPTSGEFRAWHQEPELFYDTMGTPDKTSFGIHVDPDDPAKIDCYEKHLLNNPSVIEWVDAADMVHFKNPMIPRGVKRGLPDFAFGMYDALTQADKLRNAMGVGATILASIPYIRQHETASLSQVQAFQQADKDSTFDTSDPFTGRTIAGKKILPGEIQDINKGQMYVEPPGAANFQAYIEALHMLARAAGMKWNMPEWLATGSGADIAAYSGSMTQQNPFVRTVVKEQKSIGRADIRTLTIGIEYAIERGELPENTLKLVRIKHEAPDPTHKDRLAQAQEAQILIPLGVTSRQAEIRKRGDDPEQIEQENSEWQEKNGVQMPGLDLPDDDPAAKEPGPKKPALPKA